MKKLSFLFVLAVCACVLHGKNPKYVFLFIGDGMATPQRMVADEFSRKMGRGQLALNTLPCHATTRTNSTDSLVTDSAAAATAIACGEKTRSGRIGMDSEGKRKLESVAYVAKRNGKKVGIVTSVTINHATPAGFYAHRPLRSQYYAIGLDLIGSGFDYFGGGGVQKNDDKTAPEYKGDIYKLAAEAGYKVVRDKTGLLALRPGEGKVLAVGAKGKLPYSIDARGDVATLAEYTAKGIELLDNPKGFFMMVEGGAIDWCGHANEAAGNLHEVLALDEAVRVALAFAQKHPGETLIIVTGDHETGGMTMGFAGTGYAIYMERLINQKCSHDAFAAKIDEAKKDDSAFSFEKAKKFLAADFGFRFPDPRKEPRVCSEEEAKLLQSAFKKNKLLETVRTLLDKKSKGSWTDREAALLARKIADGQKADARFSFGDAKKILTGDFQFVFDPMVVGEKEMKTLQDGFKKNKLANAARIVMAGKAGIGWTSGSHTALPVLTTSKGAGAELFVGFIENSDIARKLKTLL